MKDSLRLLQNGLNELIKTNACPFKQEQAFKTNE